MGRLPDARVQGCAVQVRGTIGLHLRVNILIK
jgi:hypothetical protein